MAVAGDVSLGKIARQVSLPFR